MTISDALAILRHVVVGALVAFIAGTMVTAFGQSIASLALAQILHVLHQVRNDFFMAVETLQQQLCAAPLRRALGAPRVAAGGRALERGAGVVAVGRRGARRRGRRGRRGGHRRREAGEAAAGEQADIAAPAEAEEAGTESVAEEAPAAEPVSAEADEAEAAPKTRRRPRARKKPLLGPEVTSVDHKDVPLLRTFISDRGKIVPSRISGLCAKNQRKLSEAIKRARSIALVPFAKLESE